jgi:hypothetical protein
MQSTQSTAVAIRRSFKIEIYFVFCFFVSFFLLLVVRVSSWIIIII